MIGAMPGGISLLQALPLSSAEAIDLERVRRSMRGDTRDAGR
jgi:hypothetical protein